MLLCDAFPSSSDQAMKKYEVQKSLEEKGGLSRYEAGFGTQFNMLFWRCWLGFARNKKILPARIAQIIVSLFYPYLFVLQVLTLHPGNVNLLFPFLSGYWFHSWSCVLSTRLQPDWDIQLQWSNFHADDPSVLQHIIHNCCGKSAILHNG